MDRKWQLAVALVLITALFGGVLGGCGPADGVEEEEAKPSLWV